MAGVIFQAEHFTLAELVRSEVAVRDVIDNTPEDWQIANLQYLALQLDKVRNIMRIPIWISSGFRSEELNKAIGSTPRSWHYFGKAADCKIRKSISEYARFVWELSKLNPDGMIIEYLRPDRPYDGWVHVSWDSEKGDDQRRCFQTKTKSSGYVNIPKELFPPYATDRADLLKYMLEVFCQPS